MSRRARAYLPAREAKHAAVWAAPEMDYGYEPEPMPEPTHCACMPGMCRGGQVVNGKLPSGLWCKARIPAVNV